jgi:predicted Fe-Mo cluster-binding NifX family protein
MKIAIPAMGETLDSFMGSTLGRAPFIVIYDSENKDHRSLINPGYKIQDGSGLKAAEIITQNNADVLLTTEIGRKAYSILLKKHIDVHLLNKGGAVESVINKFLKKAGE